MTNAWQRFPFLARNAAEPDASLAPLLPVALEGATRLDASALLDTGAAVNVLPYSMGLRLGCVWESAVPGFRLTGNLAGIEARGVRLFARIADFAPVRLAFAWSHSDQVPLLFGQTNFFLEFDVCFHRAERSFRVRPQQ